MTIREGMKHLLEADYEIALAESGVAAIRTITLNRPDLVLLDYDVPLPGCNPCIEGTAFFRFAQGALVPLMNP